MSPPDHPKPFDLLRPDAHYVRIAKTVLIVQGQHPKRRNVMISEKMNAALNDQVTKEMYSA